MGLCASLDEWCRHSDDAIRSLAGISKLVDDILIMVETLDKLEQRIDEVLLHVKKQE